MEKKFVKALYLILGIALTINLLFTFWMHFERWVQGFSREEAYVLPQVESEDVLSGHPEIHYGSISDDQKPPAEEFYLTQAELKYLAKSQELVNGVEILGIRLMQAAPRWWDEYHPIIREIDKLSDAMKKPSSPAERARTQKAFEKLEAKFVKLNKHVDATLRRFFAELEIARILVRSIPDSMSNKGREYLRKLNGKLSKTEEMVRSALWKHHILENPQDKKNGWSCKTVIGSLLVRLQGRILSIPPTPSNI